MIPENSLKVWQVYGGDTNYGYADEFIKYGVCLIEWGDLGKWSENRSYVFIDTPVSRFVQDVNIGDTIVLRTGKSSIVAIGLVVSDYDFYPQFDDVHGLDLQHGRRVRWFELPDPFEFDRPVFGGGPSRFSRVHDRQVIEHVLGVLSSPMDNWKTSVLPSLPPVEDELNEIPPNLQKVISTVRDLALLYRDRKRFGKKPKEDELLVHFIVPMLKSLGWPEELIAIKWKDIDITLFDKLPRIPGNCRFIIEAKRIGAVVETALSQAMGYMSDLDVSRDIVVTDGIRYRYYEPVHDSYQPLAYANLMRLKEGSLELFKKMEK